MKTVLLTGDHETNAKAVANALCMREYYAGLRPADKLNHIEKMATSAHLVMVGDGLNDAPALARSHVGISMGKVGSSTAIDASDVVLLNDNLEALVWLMKKARATKRIVKQNIFLAALAIACATLPALLGWVPIWLAVILHEGGTVLVGLNALRLLKT